MAMRRLSMSLRWRYEAPRRRWWHSGRRTASTSAADPSPSRLPVAVVGTGRMGELRLSGIHQHPALELAAIIDTSLTGDKAASYESRFHTRCFADLDAARDVLRDGVAGVWLATPTPTHLQLIQQCLGLGSASLRAIGVEKPVAASVEHIDAAYRACFAHNVALVCSFQRRFDPSYVALQHQCVDEQVLGALRSVHTVFRDHPCPPIEFLATGGDPFHDLAVHDIDFVCQLVGEYPSRVLAHGTSHHEELRAAGVMDQASVWLEFERTGVVCTMDLSRHATYGYDQRIEVSGADGMLQVLTPARTSVVHAGAHGVTTDRGPYSFPDRFAVAYQRELDHFVDVLRHKTPPVVHWNAARMATIVAEAARLAAERRQLVTLRYTRTRQEQPRHDPLLDVEYSF
ncbi:hypothetical protein ATCC90586_005026 [Pythium insidiosum]|nr:hypothetical protein ATCC90586_005026 [Pythium insidiosum]